MERIRSLSRYQKSVLLATALMALVFTAVYLTVTARVGFAFGDAILPDVHEVSADVYTGKVRGETVRFTVNADRSVTFQRGERLYGPYTAAEDPTAVPADSALAAYMTGVELRRGGEVVFRGGVLENGGMYLLYREDEREMIPVCRQYGVALTPYSPMASGHLTRPKWNSDSKRSITDNTMRSKYDRGMEQDLPIIRRVHEVAERIGVPMARVALAWHWVKGVTAPIVGCSKPERVDDAIAALDLQLTAEDIDYIEEPYTAHELVGPLARPGERALAGTLAPKRR